MNDEDGGGGREEEGDKGTTKGGSEICFVDGAHQTSCGLF